MIIVYFLVLENSLVTWDGRNVVALERFNFNSVRLRMNLPLTTEATEIVGIDGVFHALLKRTRAAKKQARRSF
jgi:hypothetical protein